MDTAAHSTHYLCPNNCKNNIFRYVISVLPICILSSVGGKELVVGQENLYEDPCQDWLDLHENKLTSPNYPDIYEPNTVCIWKITTDKGYYISLDFERIDVSKQTCSYV